MGRFITPDTIIPEPLNPQSFNRYSYALNNPLRYTDPTGNFAFLAFLGFIAKAAAVISAVTTVAAIVTKDETVAKVAQISGYVAAATGVGNFVGNVIKAANTSISLPANSLVSAYNSGAPPVDLGTIVVTPKDVLSPSVIVRAAIEASRGSLISAAIGGISAGASGLMASGIGQAAATVGSALVPSAFAATAGEAAGAASLDKFLANFAEGRYFGTTQGERATMYWAQRAVETGNPLYNVPGAVSAAWTPETWNKTVLALTVSYGAQVAGWSQMGPTVAWRGGEIVLKSGEKTISRLSIYGHRGGPWYRRLPHYHRRPGIKWHRPWQKGW